LTLSEPIDGAHAPAAPVRAGGRRPKLLFLATEDWYFWSDRLPFARAARAAGFDVVVAAHVAAHGERIRGEGFALRPLSWRRRGDGPYGAARALRDIVRIYRRERPDIVHHLALKPILFGGLARRLAFPRKRDRPLRVDAVMGLGSGFSASGPAVRLRRPLLRLGLRLSARDRKGCLVVQNPDDGAVLAGFGVAPKRIALIRGSGIDIARFRPLPEPEEDGVTVALVSRMLREKGVLDAVAAIRRLRAGGMAITLLLAGMPDPGNKGSLAVAELRALAREPGIVWLGAVADVRTVWRRSAVAILPSTYGEGLPRALLEAAACARPIVATDIPGCREVVRPGETGLLVPPRDVAALAAAIAALADDRARRRAMGEAGRRLVECRFAEEIVVGETLALYRRLLSGQE
jgi:glycosyltransferase involved in cell wall biosynthesis